MGQFSWSYSFNNYLTAIYVICNSKSTLTLTTCITSFLLWRHFRFNTACHRRNTFSKFDNIDCSLCSLLNIFAVTINQAIILKIPLGNLLVKYYLINFLFKTCIFLQKKWKNGLAVLPTFWSKGCIQYYSKKKEGEKIFF